MQEFREKGAWLASRLGIALLATVLIAGMTTGIASAGGPAADTAAKKKCKKLKGKKKKRCKKKKRPGATTPANPASIAVSPPAVPFGATVVGGQPTLPVTVKNVGGSPSGVPTGAVSGASEFGIVANSCTAALGPGATCAFFVKFAPIMAGARAGVLAVAASPGGNVNVPLSGSGADPATLTISPTMNTYPSVIASNNPDASQSFTVTNTGGVPTGNLTVLLTGANQTQFTIPVLGDQCSGDNLGPGQTCMITVEFNPNAVCSPCTASLDVFAPVPGPTISAPLEGTATGLTVSPTSFPFAATTPGTPLSNTFTVTNTAAVPTGALGAIVAGGLNPSDYSIANNMCSTMVLAPAGTCQFDVVFNPVDTATPGRASSANFTIGASPGGQVQVSVTGIET